MIAINAFSDSAEYEFRRNMFIDICLTKLAKKPVRLCLKVGQIHL